MYYQIFGRLDSFDIDDFERKVSINGKKVKKTFQQISLSLVIPGQKEQTKVSIDAALASVPGVAQFEKWEDSAAMLKVTCTSMRVLSGESESGLWAFATFSAVSIAEPSAQDLDMLRSGRKAERTKRADTRKQKRAAKVAAAASDDEELSA